MHKALIVFSNGESLEMHDGQLIIPISKLIANDDISVSQGIKHEIWNHSDEGLIPSIAELLCKCDFFQLPNTPNKIYKSSAVVSIENI